MIRVNVFYPRQEGGNFDYDYYLGTHIPMVREKLGDVLKRVEVYKGVAGAGGGPEPYVTAASLFFDSVEAFENSFGPHAEEIMGDIPNFTNLEPTVQIEDQLL
ncbi:MAG: EthD family reductase [Gammaproteobacteria bacterium]